MRLDDVIRLLRSLPQETSWRRFALPAEFTDDVLEQLFEAGFIEIHVWCRDERGKPMRATHATHGMMARFIGVGDTRLLGNAAPFRRVLSDPMNQGETAPEFQLSEKAWMVLRDAEKTSAAVERGRDGECLTDPIPVVRVVEVVGHKAGRSDKLTQKMKRRRYPVELKARKWYCQRADAIAMFPHHRERIEEI